MSERNELISYAMDCASYILSKSKYIDKVILHGSVARGDFDEKSDVDLFIDTKNKKLEKTINNLLDKYYKTKRFKEWELKGINKSISIIVGDLNSKEWKGLKRAIINTGIILYGKYKSNVEKVYQYTLFSFENIKPDKKRIAVFRKLFGFKSGKKKYSGLAHKIGATRISKGTILVPAERVQEIQKYFQEKKVNFKLYDLWSDMEVK